MLLSQVGRGYAASLDTQADLAEDPAYLEACRRIARARPYLAERAPAASLLVLPYRTLLHAGPKLCPGAALSPRLLRAVVAAIRREGLAGSDTDAAQLLACGAIDLKPAQDFGIVTPLDLVIGPTSPLLRLVDRAEAGVDCFAPDPAGSEPAIGSDVTPHPVPWRDTPDWLALAAIKCAVSAAGHIKDCPVVTDLGSNGSDIGLKLAGLPGAWISTEGFWFRRRHKALRQVDDGVLGAGDALVQHLLDGAASPSQSARKLPLNAADWLFGGTAPLPPMLSAIPTGLFAAALANFRRMHWTLFVQPF